jgi:hypothetical protein
MQGRGTKLSHVNLLSASWARTTENEAKRERRAKEGMRDKRKRSSRPSRLKYQGEPSRTLPFVVKLYAQSGVGLLVCKVSPEITRGDLMISC